MRASVPRARVVGLDSLQAIYYLPPSRTIELCCVLDLRENRHCPPSWVEASNSLDQVVTGSATPGRASQWSFVGPEAGPRARLPGIYLSVNLGRHSWCRPEAVASRGAFAHAADRPLPSGEPVGAAGGSASAFCAKTGLFPAPPDLLLPQPLPCTPWPHTSSALRYK
jgi:hypothetical protein